MAVREMLLLLLVLLATGPKIIFSVHRCFSNTCSSPGACIRVCEANEHYCHSHFSPNHFHKLTPTEFGCGTTSQSADHSMTAFFPDVHFSCEADLCNIIKGVTDDIQPVLGIPLNLPKDPPPQPRDGFQVCDCYHCSSAGNCSLGYEYCSVTPPTLGYCRAVYIVNTTTTKVELSSKGCQTQYDGNPQDISSECHIDNHLDSPAGALLECTCNGNLCNQNITFTHLTRHAKYGFSDCQQLNCSHGCDIVRNKPVCQCPKGFHTGIDNRTCEDINECLSSNGGCHTFCINTPGSYRCNCTEDRYLSYDEKTCKVKEGLVCSRQSCRLGQCDEEYDEYCFDRVSQDHQGDTTYCAAFYAYNNSTMTWIPQWKVCFARTIPLAYTNGSRCRLHAISSHKLTTFYSCFCQSDHCNGDDAIDFPFDSPMRIDHTTSSTFLDVSTTSESVTITIPIPISSVPIPSELIPIPSVVIEEPDRNISLPELFTIVVASLSFALVLLVLTGLWCWYLIRRASRSFAIRHENPDVCKDVGKDNSPRVKMPDEIVSEDSSQQLRSCFFDDEQTNKCGTTHSTDTIELSEFSF